MSRLTAQLDCGFAARAAQGLARHRRVVDSPFEAPWQRGIWVPAPPLPTVPQDTARLRITLTAAHADVCRLAPTLVELAR